MATPTVTPLDPSALSGAPTLGAYPPAVNPSDMPTRTEQSSQGPIQVVPNAMPPQAAGTPSVWKNLTMGALWGLSNMGRAHTFGQGVAQGAQGAIRGQQVARENAIQQQQLQFESARAADDHIRAVAQAKEADAATEDHKAQLAQYQANIDAFNEAMGIKPTLTIKGDNPNAINSQASGGLQTLASRNGGTIPGVVTVNNPAGAKNSDHSIDVYAKPTPQELQNNPNGYRKLVDTASIINNGSPTTDEQWNTGNFSMEPGSAQQGMKMLMQKSQGQAQMVLAAQQRLYGVPQVVGNPAKDDATAATLQQQLEAYQKRPDADAGVVKLLQSQLQTFQSAVKNEQSRTQRNAAQTAAGEEQAKINVQTNPANVAAQANAAGQKAKAEQAGKNAAMGDLSKTGEDYLSSLPPTESSLVRSIGTGKVAPERMSYLITRNPGLVAEVTQAYPDFDSSKVGSYLAAYKDFTSGATSKQLNSGATAVKHLSELEQLNTMESRVPGTAAHQAYMNKLDTVVSELAQFYAVGKTDTQIEGIRSTLGSVFNREAAIRTQVQSMSDKFGSYAQTWENAAPSAVYQAKMPGIDEQAKEALQHFNPTFTANHPQFAPQQRETQGQGTPVYRNGIIIGYTTDGKTMTPVGQQ